MIKTLLIAVSFFSFIKITNCQIKMAKYEFSVNSGITNATISKGMKGFFLQNSIQRNIWKRFDLKFSLGIAKSSNYTKNFDYELAPFKISDTVYHNNLDLWNLVKDKTIYNIFGFELLQVTNLYFNLATEVRLLSIRKFSFLANLGAGIIGTFSNNLYLKTISFSNGKIVAFTPTVRVDRETVTSANLGLKFKYSLHRNWAINLNIDKFFGDSGGPYSRAEMINIGVGASKKF